MNPEWALRNFFSTLQYWLIQEILSIRRLPYLTQIVCDAVEAQQFDQGIMRLFHIMAEHRPVFDTRTKGRKCALFSRFSPLAGSVGTKHPAQFQLKRLAQFQRFSGSLAPKYPCISWEALKLLNRTKSLAEKKEIVKLLSTTGKRMITVEEIRTKELPEILHQTITT